jgi:ABC-2 type transport system permease protein
MITALIVNALMGLLFGLGLALMNVESMGIAASMLAGLSVFITGMVFASVAAPFSQLPASSGGASGYSFLTLGLFYIIRAAGDLRSETLACISPLGLAQRSQFFVENNIWPMFILLAEAVIIAGAALRLNSMRDLGQGFIHAKPGRAEASKSLRTSFGLALRLLRFFAAAWIIGMFALGASYGSILGDIESFLESSEFYRMVIGANTEFSDIEMMTSMINSIMALGAMVPLLIMALRFRGEEKEERAEHILSRAVSRTKFLAGYAAVTFAASVLLQLATASGLYTAAAAVLETPISFGFLLKANFVFLPAIWVMIGLAVLLTCLLPKFTTAAWIFFGYVFFVEFIGRMLDLPEFMAKISPLSHIPQMPAEKVTAPPLIALTAIAVIFTAAGFWFYQKRDVTA